MRRGRNSVVSTKWGAIFAAFGLVVGLGAAAAPKGPTAPPGLVKVRFGGDSNQTRVVVELTRSAQAKIISTGQPLVIDLPRIDVGGEREGRGQGLVRAWSVDGTPGAARIKLDLTKAAVIERRFLLSPSEGSVNYRYVIDLKAETAGPMPAQPAEAARAPAKPVKPQPVQVAATPAAAPVADKVESRPIKLKKVIVIDAGHGGHDPGALGEKVQEKTVTLAAAKALKSRLEASGRYTVVLTRDTDAYVALDNRVQIARRAGADLFISLHADSGPNKATRGASIYTLSDKGSERVQRNLASGQSGFLKTSQPGTTLAVSQILLDLTQRATRNRSTSFAQILLDKIGDEVPLLARSHRSDSFAVLLAPDVPAVLLEMGFISNPEDEAFLTNTSKRERLVDAIGSGIDAYFSQELKLASR